MGADDVALVQTPFLVTRLRGILNRHSADRTAVSASGGSDQPGMSVAYVAATQLLWPIKVSLEFPRSAVWESACARDPSRAAPAGRPMICSSFSRAASDH